MRPQDSTFEFERKRNRVIKYDRNIMMSTINAMKRVQEIRVKRQERFFQARYAEYLYPSGVASESHSILLFVWFFFGFTSLTLYNCFLATAFFPCTRIA